METIIERFNYLDENHDGKISLEELLSYHEAFDADFDAAAVSAEFKRLDSNDDGAVDLAEYMTSLGIEIAGIDLERRRKDELAHEAQVIAQGVTAVEIVPDGSEAQEVGVRAEVRDVSAVAECEVVAEPLP